MCLIFIVIILCIYVICNIKNKETFEQREKRSLLHNISDSNTSGKQSFDLKEKHVHFDPKIIEEYAKIHAKGLNKIK